MNANELVPEIIVTYERHGWKLRRVLMSPATRVEFSERITETFGEAQVVDSDIDALWFARASSASREAWELRLLAENRYALFEAFEADESEEDREEARLEMENRMRASVKRE